LSADVALMSNVECCHREGEALEKRMANDRAEFEKERRDRSNCGGGMIILLMPTMGGGMGGMGMPMMGGGPIDPQDMIGYGGGGGYGGDPWAGDDSWI
jgi:hypothetical protein